MAFPLIPGTPIELPTFTCQVCRHSWSPYKAEVPVRCASCKTPYWNRPAQDGGKTLPPSNRKPKAGNKKG